MENADVQNQAILTIEQTLASIPDDHPDRITVLNGLGFALWKRFRNTGSMEDLSRAITINERMITLLPKITLIAQEI
jgi:hypothetical protein